MSRKRILLIIGILLLLGSVCAPVAAAWPATVYAPYVDVGLNPDHFIHLADMKTASGVSYYTLCFIGANPENGNEPGWGSYGNIPYYENSIKGEADAIRAVGGDIIVSFGGADAGGFSYTLAQKWTDGAELQAQYQKVIDLYEATWVDFDVEQQAVHDLTSIDRRNQAIAGLKAANPGLKIAYCLPCTPQSGFDAHVIKIVDSAIAKGAEIDYWNAMAMDYGRWFTVDLGLGTNMSYLGILVAENISSQLQTKYGYTEAQAYAHMGYTPMIGQTDMNDSEHNFEANEVFWLDTNTSDASVIKNFVISKNIPMMGAWSANRDNGDGGRKTTASAVYSGIEQGLYDFSKVFVQIE